MASAISLSNEIDSLLGRYLDLLHVYTQLRQDLATVQASVYQHLARANFSAERGIRYGQDLYDERMQASRLCSIATNASGVHFAVSQSVKVDESGEQADIDKNAASPNPRKDPIRMFGILTPQSLRLAQSEAIKAIEDIIPKIVSTDAEMQEVEIKIRRCRKHKAKAEAAEAKEAMQEQRETLMT